MGLYHICSTLLISAKLKLKPKQILFHATRVEKMVHNYKRWWGGERRPIAAGKILNSRAILERNSFTRDPVIAFLNL